jgi:hypothetical protein
VAKQFVQNSLFEEDYLVRDLGQLATQPQFALTELVANAWDAGASKVALVLPAAIGDLLTVTDDGHGMTEQQFRTRWMTLGYDRTRHQGVDVEFPKGAKKRARRAYGRNGVGRHGLLCFAKEYQVETWRNGTLVTCLVGTAAGSSPFVLQRLTIDKRKGHGTRLSVRVERRLPNPDNILEVLAARFVHDPDFTVSVNGKSLAFHEIEGKVGEERIDIDATRHATVIVIDSAHLNYSSIHQGIAFWVRGRLVGNPSWTLGTVASFDGRTRFARRYNVIVNTEGFEDDVQAEWTGFKNTDAVQQLFQKTAGHVAKVAHELAADVVEESSADALIEHRSELASLGRGARQEVADFTKTIAQTNPTIAPDFLAAAVKAVINLEKSKSGAALLQKLSTIQPDDVEGLDRLLEEWTVKDAWRVLDEIDNRFSVIETVRRIANDPATDELNTLHPLVLRSRWLFGPEFESEEFCSNVTLQTVAGKLFGKSTAKFTNSRKRPDIIVLPDGSSVQLTGVESFDVTDSSSLVRMQQVLLIELKRGGFKLDRKEVSQAYGYVEDMAGAISGAPTFSAWVVGQTIAEGIGGEMILQRPDGTRYGRVRPTTYSALVDTAHRRLFKLREVLSARYENVPTDKLLARVLSTPEQGQLDVAIRSKSDEAA